MILVDEDEAEITIKDLGHNKPTTDKVLITRFDDGTEGIYTLSLTHKVRIWVRWKRKKGVSA